MDGRFYGGKMLFDEEPDWRVVRGLRDLLSRNGCNIGLEKPAREDGLHVMPFVIPDLKRGVPDWVMASRRELDERDFLELCALYWEEELSRVFCCEVRGELRNITLASAESLGALLRATGLRRIDLDPLGKDDGKAEAIEAPSLQEALAELDSLIGLSRVKRQVHDIARIVQNRGAGALPCMHMVFTGNPGTGKTEVARIVARVLSALGVVSGGKFVETDRSGLVGQYVGHTAQRTRRLVESAMGGVLFIDEAYALGMYAGDLGAGPDGEGGRRDFGGEAIDTLVKLLEDRRGDFVCIMAGYPREMERMLGVNPGLRDRIGWFVDFDDYDGAELFEISQKMLRDKGYTASMAAQEAIARALEDAAMRKSENFGNARLARKLVERCVFEQNVRSTDSEVEVCDAELALACDDIAAMVDEAEERVPFGFAGTMG